MNAQEFLKSIRISMFGKTSASYALSFTEGAVEALYQMDLISREEYDDWNNMIRDEERKNTQEIMRKAATPSVSTMPSHKAMYPNRHRAGD